MRELRQQFAFELLRDARHRVTAPAGAAAGAAPHHLAAGDVDHVERDADRRFAIHAHLVAPFVDGAGQRVARILLACPRQRGLLLVDGAVPGAAGGWVLVKDAAKRKPPKDLPFPAALRAAPEAPAPEGQ